MTVLEQLLPFVFAAFLLVDSQDNDKRLYLLDLYTCVDEFEDYCSGIPRWTIRAAIEIANNRSDILPGYILSTLNKLDDNKSVLYDGEVIIVHIIQSTMHAAGYHVAQYT